ncbi:MAG: hypothetical protein ACREJ2_14925 [Planctomycetota bacterium]
MAACEYAGAAAILGFYLYAFMSTRWLLVFLAADGFSLLAGVFCTLRAIAATAEFIAPALGRSRLDIAGLLVLYLAGCLVAIVTLALTGSDLKRLWLLLRIYFGHPPPPNLGDDPDDYPVPPNWDESPPLPPKRRGRR